MKEVWLHLIRLPDLRQQDDRGYGPPEPVPATPEAWVEWARGVLAAWPPPPGAYRLEVRTHQERRGRLLAVGHTTTC